MPFVDWYVQFSQFKFSSISKRHSRPSNCHLLAPCFLHPSSPSLKQLIVNYMSLEFPIMDTSQEQNQKPGMSGVGVVGRQGKQPVGTLVWHIYSLVQVHMSFLLMLAGRRHVRAQMLRCLPPTRETCMSSRFLALIWSSFRLLHTFGKWNSGLLEADLCFFAFQVTENRRKFF